MRYHSTIIIFFILWLFAGFAQCGAAEHSKDNAIRDIRAGIFNFEGYHSKDENGNLSGYGIDLLRLLSEYSHLNFLFNGYDKSWQEMQDMLKNGEIDIVSSARRTPEREQEFAFSLPVGRNHTILVRQINNNKIRAGDYSTYNGMKVGLVAGSSQNHNLETFARDKGFRYTPVEFRSPREMSEALQTGKVDAILSSNLRKPKNETLLDIIKSDNFYVIARKEDQDIIDEINYAIEQMHLNEGDWQNDLHYRHYGPDNAAISEFSTRETDYITALTNEKTPLTVTARSNNAPYSYVENGKLTGILPDFFARVMEMSGLPYNFVILDEDEDSPKGTQTNVDIVLDRLEPNIFDEDSSYSGFTTDPYLNTALAEVAKKDFTGPIQSLAVSEAISADLDPELARNREKKIYPTSREAMDAVKNGEVDVAYVLPYSAQMYINRDPGNNLFYKMIPEGNSTFRMYVPATIDHELITILNKSIKNLPRGTLNQLASRYISYNAGEMSFIHYLSANPGVLGWMLVALGLVAILIGMYWWNRKLLASTKESKAALEEHLAIVEALSRDYINVMAINAEKGTASLVKIADEDMGEKREFARRQDPYDQVLDLYVKKKVHPDDRDNLANALSLKNVRKHLAHHDDFNGRYRIIQDGATLHFQFTFVRPKHTSEEYEHIILAGFRNITEVIEKEQDQKRALAKALKEANYANAAKTTFLNNMSHDIRTPMNAIIGFTSLASANIANGPLVQRYLSKILTSGNHLLSLINDVLDMSRIESGKVKIEEKECSLPEILHDLRTIVQTDVKAKQLNFTISAVNVHNEVIFCDRLRLNQVLLNILSNAIKYTPAGGSINMRVIELDNPQKGMATFEFRVRDTGIGMSEEFLKHVFEPFEREQTATVSGIQGTGLGLAITKNIVEKMNGEISVQSKPGEGSEFTVLLHFKTAEHDTAELPQYKGVPALVAANDLNTCASIGKILSTLGLRPDWTTLPGEALARADFAIEHGKPYGAYFIDLMMPEMNGIELTRQLRKKVPPTVPIILLTAHDCPDVEEEGRKAGVTAFCPTTVFLSEVREILADPTQRGEEGHEDENLSGAFANRRILVAEDNEMNQEIAQMVLESAGFAVDMVENGQDALDRLKDNPAGYYSLVLMDVQMPIMDGYEATRAIRKLNDKAKAVIPIIAMTANAFEEDREKALESGMNGYVPKPIDIKNLLKTLEETLRQAENS